MARARHRSDRVVIGGASGFWGDSSTGPVQLVESGRCDYLVFDYLAELTMSILVGARMKRPEAGYATDFVTAAMRQILPEVVRQGIRVVTNAGGVNPAGCAQALRALADELGVKVKIAEISGDDFMPQWADHRATAAPVDMQNRQPLPEKLISANAYFGALPVKAALDAGADIVITGRSVDSASTLGVLMHEFQWSATDWNRLAAGSLAGHIIECACQATGGLFTDWRTVPGWPAMGYPILECFEDGGFHVTKPKGTGGLVSVASVSEQLVYEIGDPQQYILPDVVCDFSQVTMSQVEPDVVDVRGAIGYPPTDTYKVSATFRDGFRTQSQLTIIGHEAAAKAQRSADALLARARAIFKARGLQDFSAAQSQVVGTAQCLGPHRVAPDLFEAVARVAVRHPQKEALEVFVREFAAAGTSWSPGTTGGGGGRPGISANIRHCAFLVPKKLLHPKITLDGTEIATPEIPAGEATVRFDRLPDGKTTGPGADWVEVPLRRVAHARSGDKGNHSNIGVIARDPADLPLLRAQLTTAAVGQYLAHLVKGPVTRFEMPGIGALNFLCEDALDGGGMSSLRNDPLGKAMGQIVLTMPVRVPRQHPAAQPEPAPQPYVD